MLADGTDFLSQDVGTELPLRAAEFPRRAQISSKSQWKPKITHYTGLIYIAFSSFYIRSLKHCPRQKRMICCIYLWRSSVNMRIRTAYGTVGFPYRCLRHRWFQGMSRRFQAFCALKPPSWLRV